MDIKLENILIANDCSLKFCDFGFSTSKDVNKLKSFRGTYTYMAPEIKEGKEYDGTKADIFSLGMAFF